MLCERCNKKKATVVYRENLSGRIRNLRLCGECTEIMEADGELEELGAALAPFASPFLRSEGGAGTLPFYLPVGTSGGRASGGALKCPTCGVTLGEITASGKVGCGTCYATFGDALEVIIHALHGKAVHTGRVTSVARRRRERAEQLGRLKRQLKDAVAAEQYERAAGLRDEIRAMEADVG